MAIDYGLGVRQAAYDRYVAAEGQKAQAEAKAEADRKRRSRQKSRGLMSLAANAGLAFATGGASIPYSGMISQTLMGDDYEGSSMQSLSGLASAAYSGVSAMKGKAIQDMQSAHDAKMDKMYKSLDALPDTPEGQIAKQNMALQAIQAEDTFQKQLQQARNKPLWEFATSEREKVIGQSTGNPANAVSQMQRQPSPQARPQAPAPKTDAEGFSPMSQDFLRDMDYAKNVEEGLGYSDNQIQDIQKGLSEQALAKYPISPYRGVRF